MLAGKNRNHAKPLRKRFPKPQKDMAGQPLQPGKIVGAKPQILYTKKAGLQTLTYTKHQRKC